MKVWPALLSIACAFPVAGRAEVVLLSPSGVTIALQQVLYEPVGVPAASAKTLRLRYVAPQLSDPVNFGFERIETDLLWLCETAGLEIATKSAQNAEQIIVSIASEPVVFGESAPNVTQYFEAFDISSTKCNLQGL